MAFKEVHCCYWLIWDSQPIRMAFKEIHDYYWLIWGNWPIGMAFKDMHCWYWFVSGRRPIGMAFKEVHCCYWLIWDRQPIRMAFKELHCWLLLKLTWCNWPIGMAFNMKGFQIDALLLLVYLQGSRPIGIAFIDMHCCDWLIWGSKPYYSPIRRDSKLKLCC